MNRDRLIELLVLEADGGLSGADSILLRRLLDQDDELRRERDRILEHWRVLRMDGKFLGLPDDYGDDRVQDLVAPRPDGLWVGVPVAWAAALFFCCTLLHGVTGPVAVGTVATWSGSAEPAMRTVARTSVYPDQIVEADETATIELPTGTRLGLRDGSVQVVSAREVSLEELSDQLTFDIGLRPTLIRYGNRSIVAGRESRGLLRVVDPDAPSSGIQVVVERGSVRLNPPFGTLVRAGETLVLPAASRPSATPVDPLPADRIQEPPAEDSREPPEDQAQSDRKAPEQAHDGAQDAHGLATLTGMITTSDGLPSTAVKVRVSRLAADPASIDELLRHLEVGLRLQHQRVLRDPGSEVREVRTDAGAFEFCGLPQGLYGVTVLADTSPKDADLEPKLLRLASEEHRQVNLRLHPGRVATGWVRDRSGQALQGVEVRSVTRSILSDRNGRFRLGGLAMESTVTFSAPGFTPAVVLAKDLRGARVELAPAPAVEGVVRSLFDRLSGARVEASFELAGKVWHREVAPDQDGRFTVSEAPAGTLVRIEARAPGHSPAELMVIAGQVPGTVFIDLSSGGTWRGSLDRRISDNEFEDVAGWTSVMVEGASLRETCASSGDLVVQGVPLQETVQVLGDEGSSRLIRGVQAGRRRETVEFPVAEARHLTVREGGRGPGREAFALWCVLDPGGRLVAAVELEGLERGVFLLPTSVQTTDAEVFLWVGAPGHEPVRVTGPLDQNLELILESTAEGSHGIR